MAMLLALGGLIFWLGAQAPNEGGEPPAYQSVLLATGLRCSTRALFTPGSADFEGPRPGVAWTSPLAGALALWPALSATARSRCCSPRSWAGSRCSRRGRGSSTRVGRAVPLAAGLYALALVLSSLALREPARRHAEVLIDAAGLAIAAIALGRSREGILPGFWRSCCSARASGWWPSARSTARPARPTSACQPRAVHRRVGAAATRRSSGGRSCCSPAPHARRRPAPAPPAAAGARPYRAGEAPLAARVDEDEVVVRCETTPRAPAARGGASRPGSLAHDQVLHQVLERLRAWLLTGSRDDRCSAGIASSSLSISGSIELPGSLVHLTFATFVVWSPPSAGSSRRSGGCRRARPGRTATGHA